MEMTCKDAEEPQDVVLRQRGALDCGVDKCYCWIKSLKALSERMHDLKIQTYQVWYPDAAVTAGESARDEEKVAVRAVGAFMAVMVENDERCSFFSLITESPIIMPPAPQSALNAQRSIFNPHLHIAQETQAGWRHQGSSRSSAPLWLLWMPHSDSIATSGCTAPVHPWTHHHAHNRTASVRSQDTHAPIAANGNVKLLWERTATVAVPTQLSDLITTPRRAKPPLPSP
ncbi:hypothetical protein BD779DRAFT_1474391 [Infundibulicybe gibba]|nr:hypothetical protein BD779DRAFT_1474391 [Infundibulicybe gibba]